MSITPQNNPVINEQGDIVPSSRDADILFRGQNVSKVQRDNISERLRTGQDRIGEYTLYSQQERASLSSGLSPAQATFPLLVPFDCKVNEACLVTSTSGNVVSTTGNHNVFKLRYRRNDETTFQDLTEDGLKTSVTELEANKALLIPGPYKYELQKNGIVTLEVEVVGSGVHAPTGHWHFCLQVSPL